MQHAAVPYVAAAALLLASICALVNTTVPGQVVVRPGLHAADLQGIFHAQAERRR